MSGPPNCFVCSSKFGIFRKQYDCKKCHRTACKSCLSHSSVLPGQGSSPHSICKYCYNEAQTKQQKFGRISPPANFKREMERKKQQEIKASNAVDPADEAITERLRKLKESYDKKDISIDEIQSRLQKLCASEPTVTMEELEYRLAKLKGSRPPAIRVHSVRKRPSSTEAHCSNDTSDSKQVKRLIRQYTDEIVMESSAMDMHDHGIDELQPGKVPANPSADDLIELARVEMRRAEEMEADENLQDEEIRKRLTQITEAPPVPIADETLGIHSNFHFDEEGMDEESSRLIRKLLEEDQLERNLQQSGVVLSTTKSKTGSGEKSDEPAEDSIEDELPWCFMCNDDATLRCLTCEDLFCRTCYRVSHRESDMKGHRTEKYVAKKTDSW